MSILPVKNSTSSTYLVITLSVEEDFLMTIRAALTITLFLSSLAIAADPTALAKRDTSRGDAMIAAYFKAETRRLTERSLSEIRTKADWEGARHKQRGRLLEMLGLDPMPEKTPLKPVITGTVEHEEFVVENLHFQSRPGLYVTGNLYRPKNTDGKKLPAILYVCGHGRVKKDGVSYGNKTHYQHHGAWFARNGYVCLTIDTLQLGEIEGVHHGTYSHDRFWWNSRGYTPAGVEAWNCVRALDYLQSRPEVDGKRLGVTGRSGGGAYSWWIAAIDERIKAAVPVAGITSLHNHVVDGTVEGHCDCMFMVNTYGWDFAQVAALVAPRPLLISNTDKDRIFPLDGVVDVHRKTRRIYDLYGAGKNLGLQITEGPHKDTQELRVHAFHWFNRFLKGEDPLIEKTAVKYFEPEQLKVFDKLPEDEINTTVDETFVTQASENDITTQSNYRLDNGGMARLRKRLVEKCFLGWSQLHFRGELKLTPRLDTTHDGLRLQSFDFDSQEHVPLTLFLVHRESLEAEAATDVVLNVLDENGWGEFQSLLKERGLADTIEGNPVAAQPTVAARGNIDSPEPGPPGMVTVYFCPRGIGPTAWDQSKRKQTQIRRRFALLGQTLDGMRLYDVLRATRAVTEKFGLSSTKKKLWLRASGSMAAISLYANVFGGSVRHLELHDLPATYRDGPEFLNVLRVTSIQEVAAQSAYRRKVVIYDDEPEKWAVARKLTKSHELHPYGGFEIRPVPK
jgi:dienelactone hydrolase